MFDLIAIAGPNDPVRKRIQDLSVDFGYSLGFVDSVDEYMEQESRLKTMFIVCSATEVKVKSEIAGMTQVVRNFAVDAFIVMVIDGKMSVEDAQFVKKSGANLILLEQEAINSAKIDLIASQKIKYKYLPIKVHELKAGAQIGCDIMHLMPLNNKYLKIMHKGSVIAEDKLAKLANYGEVYINKDELKNYEKYLEENRDGSSGSAIARCRHQMLNLTVAYIDLILNVLDQSEFTSYVLGKQLYDRCQTMAGDLLASLGSVPDPWSIINNTSIGDFGSVERGPSIAAYAGLLSLNAKVGEPTEVMVAALLMDVGLLDLEPKIARKIRQAQEASFSEEERKDYQNHPITSLHRILGRKLPMTDPIKEAILGSHEQSDGQGFPHRWRGDKVPAVAQILQLSEMIDKRSLIKMGQSRPDIQQVKEQIVQQELGSKSRFNLDFIQRVRPYLSG